MKKYRWFIIGIVSCLSLAVVSYLWTDGLITSVIDYRSPIHNSPPAPGPLLGKPITRRVVIVLIDALRVDTSNNNYVMPYMNELRGQGASATAHSQPPSYSEPGYTTILTGAWPDINDGPVVNLGKTETPTFTQDDIFSDVHRAGMHTAISGYYWFGQLLPQESVDTSFYTSGEDATADQEVMKAASPVLSGNYQLVLIHIDQVDYAGHFQGGPLSPNWDTAAKHADDYLREIVAKLDLAHDTVIVLSDHGQIDRGGHGGPEPVTLLEPFVMAGAGVQPGKYSDIQQADVAPTIAALLGTNIPASAEGVVQTRMLTIPAESVTKIRAVEMAQKKLLFQAYISAIKTKPTLKPDMADPFSYIIAMNDARANRLSKERVWRILIAILLSILPACILILRGEKKALWLAAGALTYVLMFNFRYAVLDGRSYSLSSVDSETWLFTYTAVTSAISITVSWLVAMVPLHAFESGPHQASETSLGFVLFTLYLLALPVLVSFAINGILVTWTLPEFYTIFIALLSLIQWRFVVAVGLALTGAAALIAHYVPQPVKSHKRSRR